MFGKIFDSMFTGSMVGTGPAVFAVMAYVIANTRDSVVELNPPVLAALIGCPVGEIRHAIKKLCDPDPDSRTEEKDGRRLTHQGAFIYHVTTFEKYRNMRDEGDRRAYMRDLMRKRRAKERGEPDDDSVSDLLAPVSTGYPALAQAETEPEAESEPRSSNPRLRSDSSASPTRPPKLTPEEKAQRLAAVTEDAVAAYNEILAKPKGVLPKCRPTIGKEKRRQNVKRVVKLASEICAEKLGGPAITPKFWRAYFGDCSRDDFMSGRKCGGNGHENWTPDFEYLTRAKTMLRVFDRLAK